MKRKHSRRTFLAASAAGLALAGRPDLSCPGLLAEDAATLVSGKDQRLLVLKTFPAVLETPLTLLAVNAITPKSLLFVRNNQQPDDAATMAPSPHRSWKISLTGGISRPLTVTLAQLREMESVEYEMVLQCSGNHRSLFSKAAPTSGTQWGRGGMGNVRFSGVLLSTILEKHGVDVGRSVRFVNASGADEPLPDTEDFMHSLPVDDVLNRSILALDLNGEPLPAIHGGPVRLMTPGVYGTMHIKWLSELDFVTEESANHNHVPRYRVPLQPIRPGTEYDFTLQNSSYNWNMKVKSVFLSPNDGDTLRPGRHTIKGVAFNDGQARITSVILSLDRGQSWRQAMLTHSSSAYGWTMFQVQQDLPAGRHSLWCRAIDAHGRSQPLNGSIAWNPRGYEWNGVEQIDVQVG